MSSVTPPSAISALASVMVPSTVSLNNSLNNQNAGAVLNSTNNTPVQPIHMGQILSTEEKVYKKEKQIQIEFDTKSKDLKCQLNDGLKSLEQRMDTQIAILYEIQDYFKKRAEVELQYSRDLDKLNKSILEKHKSEKKKRETWHLHSAYKLWEALLNDTKHHSKYHQVASDVCSKYVADKFDEIVDDIKRIFTKCKSVGQASHDEIFRVVGELNAAMKTYHEYQSESKQAEAKLKYVQSQKPKYEKQKSKKKLKHFEKQVEKRLQKYTETKVKAFKARNEYILSIHSANACISKFCGEDIGDLIDCMDFGFHSSVAKCIYMYLSAQENIKRSRQITMDSLSRSIGDLDSNADKINYLDYFSQTFNIQKKFQFEPHKGDEVSQVNAQSLIRYEMEKRFEQLDNRLKTLKTENDEIFKTIEATEKSLLNYFDIKNCDVTDLFRDLNLPNQKLSGNKEKRVEIEDYYVEKVRQYTTSSNLIARLEARHGMMQKALNGCVNSSDKTLENMDTIIQKKKKIGKAPLIGQPRLFGGKLIEYIDATNQKIPPIITSCIKAINRLGLHNQGIFRIPGSQLEINQFKEAFEKGEDPLVTVNPREMNSVAGVLKLYLRELKEPLFPRDMYDSFLNAIRFATNTSTATNIANSNNSLASPTIATASNALTALPSTPTTPNTPPTTITMSSSNESENIEVNIKVENIKKVISSVPKPIYVVLRYLFAFLNHLSEFKDENMMDAYNIAICLAPTLIPVPEDKKDQVNHQTDTIELIKLIIQHSDNIFTMDCDGPVYEKFDSELDNDDEIEESDVDDEDDTERNFMRNLSDDEFNAAEAIALYDYKGRSDKELSFKKGSLLSIRGQLSADWWQGHLVSPQNANQSTTVALKLIPDKYIALRSSSKRKTSTSTPSTNISTPMSINNAQTPASIKQTMHLTNRNNGQNGSITKINRAVFNAANSIDLDLNRSNLSELSRVKESDILNDEENDTSSLNKMRSPSVSFGSQLNHNQIGNNKISYLKNRNSSMSSNSFNLEQNGLANANSVKYLNNNQSNNNSFENILSNTNKNNENLSADDKINQIEDALASVLDDMKQLDFTAGLSSKFNLTPNLKLSSKYQSTNGNVNNTQSLLTTTTNGTTQSNGGEVSTTNRIKTNGLLHKNLISSQNNILNANRNGGNLLFDSDYTMKSSTLMRKSPNVNKFSTNTLNKRPDLVLDLPINLLISSQNKQAETTVRRKSIEQSSTSSTSSTTPSTTAESSSSSSPLTNQIGVEKSKEKLHSSSTTSTESSASVCSLNFKNSTHLKSSSNETEKVLPMRSFNIDFVSTENDFLKANSNTIKQHSSKIINLPNPSHSVELSIDQVDSDLSKNDELNSSNESSLNKLSNCSSEQSKPLKKKPPPLMKKPEKSDEILRKLGKSPPLNSQLPSNEDRTALDSVVTEPITTNLNSQNETNKSNLSIRLSNSKATDV